MFLGCLLWARWWGGGGRALHECSSSLGQVRKVLRRGSVTCPMSQGGLGVVDQVCLTPNPEVLVLQLSKPRRVWWQPPPGLAAPFMCHPEAGRRATQGFDCPSGPHWTRPFSFIYSAGVYQGPLLALASTREMALNKCSFYTSGANRQVNKQLQNKGECWKELLEEGQLWEECSKIRQQLCKGQEKKEHPECRGVTMLGFWVNLRQVGLGPQSHGEPCMEGF